MELLEGAVRQYAWGSHTAIAALCGRSAASDTPEAELWFGAHAKGPSRLASGKTLIEHIDADPERVLGPSVSERFDARLPFLLKVLAADEPLSLQAHPSPAQAVEGFSRENERGIALDSPERNYVDANHKPELLCAVDEFEVLCGFRDPDISARAIAGLNVGRLDSIVTLLNQANPAQALREATTTLLSFPSGHHAEVISETAASAAILAETDSPFADNYRMITQLGKRYPDDPGVIVALLLNHLTLNQGEAIFMPAGHPHAYLRGVGIELMAASDNVLRGGLTSKHVDVPELLRVLNFSVLENPVTAPLRLTDGVVEWPLDIPEFRLRKLQIADDTPRVVDVSGPYIAMCWDGPLNIADRISTMNVKPGQAVFGDYGPGEIRIEGNGVLYLAQPG